MTSSTMHARDMGDDQRDISLLSLTELVTWLGCLGIGIAGFLIPYPHPKPPTAPPIPVTAQIVHVDLTNDQSPPPPDITPQKSPTEAAPQPPALPAVGAVPTAPTVAAVVAPNSSIAFAQPTQIASATQTSTPLPNQSSQPQHLVYGQGEGRQPAPDYPREAAMAHQQGNVVVRFVVGESGKVQSAQAVQPCPYPLLNQAAVRAIREAWRFHPGPVRNYEVTIVFQLR